MLIAKQKTLKQNKTRDTETRTQNVTAPGVDCK